MFVTKSNGLMLGLSGVFVVLALSASLLGVRYALLLRSTKDLQRQSAVATQQKGMIQALANDAAEFSRRHPSISQILDAAASSQKAQKAAASSALPAAPAMR